MGFMMMTAGPISISTSFCSAAGCTGMAEAPGMGAMDWPWTSMGWPPVPGSTMAAEPPAGGGAEDELNVGGFVPRGSHVLKKTPTK